jgi:DNA polymerase-1
MRERFLLGLAIRTLDNTWYIPVGHKKNPLLDKEPENVRADLSQLFTHYEGPISAHNMKFDYNVLHKADILLPVGNLWCTMMMSVYLDENHQPGHSLDAVLYRYRGVRKLVDHAAGMRKIGWETTPPSLMDKYACQDVTELPELRHTLLSLMEPKHIELWENYDRKFMLLLAEIERRGILIDRELCSQLQDQCQNRLIEIRQELGFDPAKPSQLHPKLFDDPPFGLGLRIPSRTPKGKPQVSLSWLASVGHPVTALIYEYRKTSKQLSSYFSSYFNLTTWDYARLHPNFKQHGTETGRLSCENPNLQQIPRDEYKDASVKKLFLPEEGKQLWEIDYRTIEYRMQAVYADSATLLDLFENEGDFHQLVADDISRQIGKPISRQQAKTINYLMSFGGGIGVLSAQLGVPYNLASSIHSGYKEAYPEIFARAEQAEDYATANMEVDMWHGRTRHFRFSNECRSAFNACIQGGSFEIVKRSMLMLQEAGFTISNQVHDSVWINVDGENEVIEAQKIMEDWTKPTFGLSFRTDRKKLAG